MHVDTTAKVSIQFYLKRMAV